MRICFKHAQVWKDGSLRPADVLVSDGRIVSIGDRVSCSTDTVCIEVHNAVIFPGFVDVHVHLREPGFSYKETIAPEHSRRRTVALPTWRRCRT